MHADYICLSPAFHSLLCCGPSLALPRSEDDVRNLIEAVESVQAELRLSILAVESMQYTGDFRVGCAPSRSRGVGLNAESQDWPRSI